MKVKPATYGRVKALRFNCPGCGMPHIVTVEGVDCWGFNGDYERPTLTPSIKVDNGGLTPLCHSFITNGQIQFLNDCAHDLAGQTVDLPDVDEI